MAAPPFQIPKSALVICCYVTNHPKAWWLKTNIYYCIVLVGQEPKRCLAEFPGSGSIAGSNQNVSRVMVSSEGLTKGRSRSNLTHIAVDRIQFLRTSVHLWLLTDSQPQFHVKWAPPQDNSSKTEATFFYSLSWEETFHHICHVLCQNQVTVSHLRSMGGYYTKI